MIHAHCNKKGTDKDTHNFIQTNGKENRIQPIFSWSWLDLPLTVMETFWLLVVPAVLFATHLYVKLPLFVTILLNIPWLLLPNRTSFSKKWYIAGGFALAAEQLKNTTSFRHALLAETFVVNCTSSGLTEKRRDRHRDTLISKELTKLNNTQLMNEADYNNYFCINFIRHEFFLIIDQGGWYL